MTAVGYNIAQRLILVKNSFDTGWGSGGYGLLPFEYVTSETFEKWIFDISDQPIV